MNGTFKATLENVHAGFARIIKPFLEVLSGKSRHRQQVAQAFF